MSIAGCLLAIGDGRRSMSASPNTLSDGHCPQACVSRTLGTLSPQVQDIVLCLHALLANHQDKVLANAVKPQVTFRVGQLARYNAGTTLE